MATSAAWRSPRPRRCASSTPPATTRIVVETVGVGQAEVEVAAATDTAVVVLAPGMGDGVQMAKAGILEVADVFVVNKADREGADDVVRELRQMLHLGAERDWDPPILMTAALEEVGLEELWEALETHADHVEASGRKDRKRRDRLVARSRALRPNGSESAWPRPWKPIPISRSDWRTVASTRTAPRLCWPSAPPGGPADGSTARDDRRVRRRAA